MESTDKGGNFVGWLYVDGKNLSLLLVQVCKMNSLLFCIQHFHIM